MEISYNELLGLISLGAMFLLFCTGFPISFIMIFSGLVFGYLGFGKVVFMLLTLQFDQLMTDSVMGAIPPFLLMGYLLENHPELSFDGVENVVAGMVPPNKTGLVELNMKALNLGKEYGK